MKVGIITLPLHTNYGGILQTYALQTILQRAGHDVSVVEKTLGVPKSLHWLLYTYRFLKKTLVNKNIEVFEEKKRQKESLVTEQYTRAFIDTYINRLTVGNLSGLISKMKFEAFISGSDQIWRPIYCQNIYHSYLSFTKSHNVKRLSYAPSFGTDKWEYTDEQTSICSELLKRFDLVTVREDSAIAMCEKYLGVTPRHVLDPTMLLDNEDYMNLVGNHSASNSGNVLVYILDMNESIRTGLDSVAKQESMKLFKVGSMVESKDADISKRINPPVESWIKGFIDCEYVITDSFHGSVFSIIFNKPFVVLGNKERGMSRIESLLRLFNLDHLMIDDLESADVKSLFETIKWDYVNARLSKLRQDSIGLLLDNLSVKTDS